MIIAAYLVVVSCMLEVQQLACQRNNRFLFQRMSWQAQLGQTIQLAGANGCGKSSLLAILAGLLRPPSGRMTWQGYALFSQITPSYLGHDLGLTELLTVYDNAVLFAALAHGDHSCECIEGILQQWGLLAYRHRAVATLSRGLKQRMALIRLVMSVSPLWLLDEPATGLDEEGMDLLVNFLKQHSAKGGIAVITSHQIFGGLEHISQLDMATWTQGEGICEGVRW